MKEQNENSIVPMKKRRYIFKEYEKSIFENDIGLSTLQSSGSESEEKEISMKEKKIEVLQVEIV